MNDNRRILGILGKGLLATTLLFAAPGLALAAQESTIFRYDGQDFIRDKTTLTKDDGTPAVNTKLDRNSPAYKHLVQKQSYTGPAKLFGLTCDAIYAPVLDTNGTLTGAVFVATCEK